VSVKRVLFPGLCAAIACSPGYRTEKESKELRAEIGDRTIESRVRIALAGDDATRGRPIEVQCVEGAVYLRGAIEQGSPAAVRARSLALGVEGVKRVVVRFAAD
jgi:osmotically-inducible protein OsmY